MTGKVKWFSNERGYGFIEYKPNKDVYVHYSTILEDGFRSLVKGEEVEFDLVKTYEGYRAKNVKSLNTKKELYY